MPLKLGYDVADNVVDPLGYLGQSAEGSSTFPSEPGDSFIGMPPGDMPPAAGLSR